MKHLPVQVSLEEVKRRKQWKAGKESLSPSLPFDINGCFFPLCSPSSREGELMTNQLLLILQQEGVLRGKSEPQGSGEPCAPQPGGFPFCSSTL